MESNLFRSESPIASSQWGRHLNHWQEWNSCLELQIYIFSWGQSVFYFIYIVSFRKCVILQAKLQRPFVSSLEERSPVKGLLSFTEVIRGLANQSMFYFRSDIMCNIFFKNFWSLLQIHGVYLRSIQCFSCSTETPRGMYLKGNFAYRSHLDLYFCALIYYISET